MDGAISAMAIPAAMPADVPDRTIHHGSAPAASASGDADTSPGAATGASVIKRRAPIACRRCRRMRSKCVHDKAQPPCKACLEAGLGASDCVFPVRGQPDNDREFRHPRVRADKSARRDPAKVRREILDAPVVRQPGQKFSDEWDRLPPLADILDGIDRFTRHYFQLGFIPKDRFPKRLRDDHQSVSVFLVVSILSISARLSPALATRYGSGLKAAEFFMERASQLAYNELYQEPTLDRCQGFYLLSIAQQGSGLSNTSYINMGVSMRMASLMRLHREETYDIPNPTPELLIQAESARRTLWMLHSQDQLHSSPYSPVSLAASDITALLPCEERDFAMGREPVSRAALEGTPPADENPALIFDAGRSLFASLIQAHHFWGSVSRRAVNFARSASPWDPNSEFAILTKKLQDWEYGLPQQHQWSPYAFQQFKADGQDLAYLGVTMIPRLCNIVSRRPYLLDFLTIGSKDENKQAYFSKLSLELFHNVRRLFDQIDAQFTGRSPDESVGAQMAAFCVYSCGLFSTYLCRYPNICPDPGITRDGPMMLHRTLSILMECKEVWPLASRWVEALDRFARDPNGSLGVEGSMADGKDPIPNPVAISSPPSMVGTAAPGNSNTVPVTSPNPSPSSSSLYGQPRGSMDSSQPASNLQSPSPHDLMTPMTSAATHIPQHYAHQQQQHHQHHHQQQQQHHHHQHQHQHNHHQHHQQTQQQQPTPIPVPIPIPDPQSYPQHLSQLYMTADNNVGNSNPMGMLMGDFESSQNAAAAAAAAAAASAQGYSLPNSNTLVTSAANTAFYPSADGFEGELQFYINGPQEWMPNGVFNNFN